VSADFGSSVETASPRVDNDAFKSAKSDIVGMRNLQPPKTDIRNGPLNPWAHGPSHDHPRETFFYERRDKSQTSPNDKHHHK
jgi:hypothetical protein